MRFPDEIVIASEAMQSILPLRHDGLLRFARNDVALIFTYVSAFPRHDAPELCMYALPRNGESGATLSRERGMPGARCTRSRVREV
jgi:hypothetical protein